MILMFDMLGVVGDLAMVVAIITSAGPATRVIRGATRWCTA